MSIPLLARGLAFPVTSRKIRRSEDQKIEQCGAETLASLASLL